jgi:phage head maturation protease
MSLHTRDAASRPSTFDDKALTVEATIATAAPVTRRDAVGPFMEILDINGADLAALRGVSVLDSHRQDGLARVLGVVEASRIEGTEIIAKIKFSSRPDVAPVVDDVRAGVIKFLSVGYSVEKWTDGRDASGNRTRTAIRWTPREVSFVAVPADRTSRVRHTMENNQDTGAVDRATVNRSIRDLGTRAGVADSVINDLVDREASLEEARAAILDNMLERGRVNIRTATHNDNSLDNPDVRIQAMGEALFARTAAPGHQPSEHARAFIGLTIPEMARDLLRRAGVNTTGLSADTVITRALHSTSDFPLILADSLGKSLRAAYTAAPSGIRQLARQTTVTDFRVKSRIQLDHSGFRLEKVAEHGEFKSGSLVESAESYRADTYGKIFGVTRQLLVNDDLSAMSDLSRRLGLAAAAFEAQFLVDLLQQNSGAGPTMSDGVVLFHANHGNLAGTGAAPAEATLSAARLAMRAQTGKGGGLISVIPRYVLVPSAHELTVEKLLSTIQATKTSDVNPFAALQLIVEPRLSSATRWYVFADPAQIDGLEYCYLAGSPGPQIESRLGFEIDGVQIRVRLDFGAGAVDWRGMFMNPGA